MEKKNKAPKMPAVLQPHIVKDLYDICIGFIAFCDIDGVPYGMEDDYANAKRFVNAYNDAIDQGN